MLTSYSTIPDESAVLFNEVLLNEGNGWVSCFKYLLGISCFAQWRKWMSILFQVQRHIFILRTFSWKWILLLLCYRYHSTTGTYTVTSGGDGFYYFAVYCLQIWQHNFNSHSDLWWKWIILLLCLLFTDMRVQPKHSQCPLVDMDVITSLFIVYRYDNATSTFTVTSGGNGFYYFFVYCL